MRERQRRGGGEEGKDKQTNKQTNKNTQKRGWEREWALKSYIHHLTTSFS